MTFTGTLVAGVLLHLDMPVGRRVLVTHVNTVLAAALVGKLQVDGVGHVGLHGATGVSAHMVDDEGVTIVRAGGIEASLSVVDIVRSVLAGKDDLRVSIAMARVDWAEVDIGTRADGRTRLEAAFEPRPTPGPSSTRRILVDLPSIDARHVWAHGRLASVPPLDADADAVHASVHVAPGVAHVDVPRATLRTRGLPRGADLTGAAEANVVVPAASGRSYSVDASYRGNVGPVPATSHFTFDGVRIDAVADVPAVDAAAIRKLLPEAPIHEAASAHVVVHGDLPHLDGNVHATLGAATLTAQGNVQVSAAPTGTVHLVASGVDAHAFARGAPRTSAGATANVSFAVNGGAISGAYDATTARSTVNALTLPQVTLRGDYRVVLGGADPVVTVHGKGQVIEAGATADVGFTYVPDGRSQVLSVDAHSSIAHLSGTRLGHDVTGHAKVDAAAHLHFPERTLEAVLVVDVADGARGAIHLGNAHLEAHATGSLDAPAVSTAVTATKLSMGALHFARGTVATNGPLAAMSVAASLAGPSGAPDVQARGRLGITGEGVRLEDGIVQGLGAPIQLSGHRGEGAMEVHVATKSLDVACIGGLLGMTDRLRTGTVALDATLAGNDRTLTGSLTLDVLHAGAFAAKDGNAHVDATFDGRRVALHARASEAGMGTIDVRRADVQIAGDAPLDADSWKNASGDVDIEAHVGLAKLLAFVPGADALPFRDIGGTLGLRATMSRPDEAGAAPSFHVALETAGLTLASAKPTRAVDGTLVLAQDGKRITGLDLQLGANLDGLTGDMGLDARVVDRRGILVALDARASAVPYGELLGSDAGLNALLGVPFAARAVMPRRPFSSVPLVGDNAGGEVTASLAMQGTVIDPTVQLEAHMFGAKSPQAPITNKIDADLTAEYAAGIADASLVARTPKAKVLTATGHLTALLQDFVGANAKKDPPWEASADAKLERFPLFAVAALSDRQVRGRLSGEVALTRLHGDAQAKAQLRVESLEVGSATFTTAQVDASVSDGAFRGTAHLERPGGFADARADVGVTWGAMLVPRVDATKAALLTLRAQAFPIAALGPFVEPMATDLDGKLDADARYSVAAGGGGARATGSVSLRDGTVQVTAIGQEFHGIQGKLTLSQDGVLRLDDARALGTAGLVMATGAARLDGLRIANARASIRIPKNKPIPIGVQGVQMGDMYGDLQVAASSSADGKVTNISVDVPTLHVRMPASSPHSAQVLDEQEKIRVGTFRAPGQFITLPIDGEDLRPPEATPGTPTRVNVAFHLGQDVSVERGRTMHVVLDGNPEVHVSDKTRMSGQIRLKSGVLEVQGKRFEIEKGTVSFVGDDPGNPEVVVTAGWTAADGTRVLADFVGPLKTGKVTLRSEPGRPQNEILALILFGTADGAASTPYAQPTADGATRAGTAAGSIATQGLTEGIDSLTGLDVETKVDTTDAANPRPEVELRIARDISLQVAFVLGTPPPGANPDRTFATVDWRFLRNWSLATTFGDQGSSIADVIWRYRY